MMNHLVLDCFYVLAVDWMEKMSMDFVAVVISLFALSCSVYFQSAVTDFVRIAFSTCCNANNLLFQAFVLTLCLLLQILIFFL